MYPSLLQLESFCHFFLAKCSMMSMANEAEWTVWLVTCQLEAKKLITYNIKYYKCTCRKLWISIIYTCFQSKQIYITIWEIIVGFNKSLDSKDWWMMVLMVSCLWRAEVYLFSLLSTSFVFSRMRLFSSSLFSSANFLPSSADSTSNLSVCWNNNNFYTIIFTCTYLNEMKNTKLLWKLKHFT